MLKKVPVAWVVVKERRRPVLFTCLLAVGRCWWCSKLMGRWGSRPPSPSLRRFARASQRGGGQARRRSVGGVCATGMRLVLFIVLPLFNLVFTSDIERMFVLARDPSVQTAMSR